MIQKMTETDGAGRVKLLSKLQRLRIERSLTEAWNYITS